ncbi:hypothetical protein [Armatimonas sp.]|uniref:hypothetical protein n=1 Tax=Armatimonas sp. TaxID=1872638 RepID=UPI00286B26FF|nr:hypothetical protein [Armatimonas sp.]
MMQMQVQKTRTEKEREKRLMQLIVQQGVVGTERELARCEPETVLPLLTRLYTKETLVITRIRSVVTVGLCTYFSLIILYYVVSQHFYGLWPLFTIPVWNLLGWRTKKKQAALQRLELLATLLLERVKLAPRSELGTLLDLAPQAWESAILLIPIRDRLAHLLARTPTNELFLLTPEQRAGLQFATRKAIDEAHHNDFFEPLAVAGLLALGSLKDRNLGGQAGDARVAHKCERIRMAAEEYLRALM